MYRLLLPILFKYRDIFMVYYILRYFIVKMLCTLLKFGDLIFTIIDGDVAPLHVAVVDHRL